jgi:hypothetical protein
MSSLRRTEGYMFQDRGLTDDGMRLGILESALFTCPHCNRVIAKNPQRTRPRGYCAKCNRTVCDLPVCNSDCNPILRDVSLAQRFPGSGQPFLLRGPQGEVLYDLKFQDKERIFPSGSIRNSGSRLDAGSSR